MFRNIKELSKHIPKLLKYVEAVKIVLHNAKQAKDEIETLFDDVEGNEPIYLKNNM